MSLKLLNENGEVPTQRGDDLIKEVLNQEIQTFEDWFKDPKRGNSTLTRMEKEILRVYLYQKVTGTL